MGAAVGASALAPAPHRVGLAPGLRVAPIWHQGKAHRSGEILVKGSVELPVGLRSGSGGGVGSKQRFGHEGTPRRGADAFGAGAPTTTTRQRRAAREGTNRWEATDCEHADLPDDTISISIQCGTSSAENPLDTGTPPRCAPVHKRHLADCRGKAVTRYSVRLEVGTRKPSAAQSCDHNRHGGASHS